MMTILKEIALVLVVIALAAVTANCQTIEIISSTPMGFPCTSAEAFGCIEKQNGWLVMAKGSAKLYKATLRYRDANEEKTLTVIDGPAPSGIASFAFRPGRWLPQSDFIDATVTELHEGASAKQDRSGAIVITPAGPPVFGPPIAVHIPFFTDTTSKSIPITVSKDTLHDLTRVGSLNRKEK